MKKLRILLCCLCVLALCFAVCGCGNGGKYTVRYTNGESDQLSGKEIVKMHSQEPTRDNPTNLMEGATVSGSGTVTSFSCTTDTSIQTSNGTYDYDKYLIELDNCITIEFRTPKDSGVTLQLYVNDEVTFSGVFQGLENSTYGNIVLNPADGYNLNTGDSTGIYLS